MFHWPFLYKHYVVLLFIIIKRVFLNIKINTFRSSSRDVVLGTLLCFVILLHEDEPLDLQAMLI